MLTCAEKLAEAREARHEIEITGQVQTVTHNGRSVTYRRDSPEMALARIDRYIEELIAECGTDAEKLANCRGKGRARAVTWR